MTRRPTRSACARRLARATTGLFLLFVLSPPILAQGVPPTPPADGVRAPSGEEHALTQQMDMPMGDQPAWHFMQDGNAFLLVNRQGGPRGDTELRAPNWWMGMASHPLGPGTLTLSAMFSLDPATVGRRGYAELFQNGETYRGRPLIDRQHPHDLTSQLAAAWRVVVGRGLGLTLAGGPVGEPALGPVAFMHRPSATDNPVAPLTHHVFDSTHISMGVITVAVDRGPLVLEASLFNGREPNENRWNLIDAGRLDSVSARFWFRPAPSWLVQVSAGHLVSPEALHPGNTWRTTATLSWLRRVPNGFLSVSGGYGRNDKSDESQNAIYVEATRAAGRHSLYARVEALQAETDVLLSGGLPIAAAPIGGSRALLALTGGAVRRLADWRGVEVGLGADVTTYRVPAVLDHAYGAHPVSFHVFLQVRPPVSAMGRMWNMTMSHLVEERGNRGHDSSMPAGMPMDGR